MSDLFANLNIADSASSPQLGATDLGSAPPVQGEFKQLSLGIVNPVGGGACVSRIFDPSSGITRPTLWPNRGSGAQT
jgi:hypothetical protein